MEGIVKISFDKAAIAAGVDVISFLANSQIFTSKGEARKMIQNGGLMINRKKVEDLQLSITTALLLHNKYILVQKGKKNYYLVEVV